MQFDPENNIVKRCAEGMMLEGAGQKEAALALFTRAWEESSDNFEKFISAHYVARHQRSLMEKLEWDQRALAFALQINDENIKEAFPSLYLNIAKVYEDMKAFDLANEHYQIALSLAANLPDDGYGTMIKCGIDAGIKRMKDVLADK